jgi:hypothetical protein
MIHALPQAQYGATHVREGQWRINRAAQTATVELQPGTLDGDGNFVAHPRIGWTESRIGPDRWADFVAYCESWDAEDRPLATLALSCALEYMALVDAGMRTLPEPAE